MLVFDWHWNSRQPKLAESQKSLKMPTPKDEDNEDEEEEHENTLCGACGDNYANDEFWICCDLCEKWFHGKCVRITPAKAEHIKQYKCPGCSSHKRARPWPNLKLDDRFIREHKKNLIAICIRYSEDAQPGGMYLVSRLSYAVDDCPLIPFCLC